MGYFEHGGERLDVFEHPADVIYAFGPDSTDFVPQGGKTYVEIPALPAESIGFCVHLTRAP